MVKEIDDLLDLFCTKNSGRYMDKTIWKELFDIVSQYETRSPEVYNFEIARIRDLKNTVDTAYELGRQEGRKIIKGS